MALLALTLLTLAFWRSLLVGGRVALGGGRLVAGLLLLAVPGRSRILWGGLVECGAVARRLILRRRRLLVRLGRFLGFLDRIDDLQDAAAGLGILGRRGTVVADLGPVGQPIARAGADRLEIERLDVIERPGSLFALKQIPRVEDRGPLAFEVEHGRGEAEVVGGGQRERDPGIARDLDPVGLGLDEADLGDAVGEGLDVVDDRLRIQLTLGRLELDGVRAVLVDPEPAGQFLGIAP
nr:hypothetical protein [Tautonia marina]